jgi:hypothetical protein
MARPSFVLQMRLSLRGADTGAAGQPGYRAGAFHAQGNR